MALGLPGLHVGGPIFITGEPLRQYNFQFRLTKPAFILKNRPDWTNLLFSDLFLLYISGLAEKVNLPTEKFTLGQVQMSVLKLTFPQSFDIPNFSVQYLEDELMSVARFHMIWQNSIRGIGSNSGIIDERGGLSFDELGNVCCGAIYAPSKKLPNPSSDINVMGISPVSPAVEIPLGGEIFPYVFPTDISREAGDKAGSGVSKTTVTYARIPDVSSFTSSSANFDKVKTTYVV